MMLHRSLPHLLCGCYHAFHLALGSPPTELKQLLGPLGVGNVSRVHCPPDVLRQIRL